MALYWMPPSDPMTDWLLHLLEQPAHPVEVADEAGARRSGVEHDPHDMWTGGKRHAGLGHGLPRLPAAGIWHRERTGDVDAVDFEMERRVAGRRRDARLNRVVPR